MFTLEFALFVSFEDTDDFIGLEIAVNVVTADHNRRKTAGTQASYALYGKAAVFGGLAFPDAVFVGDMAHDLLDTLDVAGCSCAALDDVASLGFE